MDMLMYPHHYPRNIDVGSCSLYMRKIRLDKASSVRLRGERCCMSTHAMYSTDQGEFRCHGMACHACYSGQADIRHAVEVVTRKAWEPAPVWKAHSCSLEKLFSGQHLSRIVWNVLLYPD